MPDKITITKTGSNWTVAQAEAVEELIHTHFQNIDSEIVPDPKKIPPTP